MTQTETTPISGLTLDSLFRENSDSISSEDDEPPLMSPDATGTTAKTDGAIHEWVAKNVVDATSQPPVLRKTSLSLSGKLLLPLADHFLVQWPQLAHAHPKARYIGRLA